MTSGNSAAIFNSQKKNAENRTDPPTDECFINECLPFASFNRGAVVVSQLERCPAILEDVNAAKHDVVESTLGSFSKNVAKKRHSRNERLGSRRRRNARRARLAQQTASQAGGRHRDLKIPMRKTWPMSNAAKHDAVKSSLGSFSKNVAKNVTAAMSVSAADAREMLVEHGSHYVPPPRQEEVKRPNGAYENSVRGRAPRSLGALSPASRAASSLLPEPSP